MIKLLAFVAPWFGMLVAEFDITSSVLDGVNTGLGDSQLPTSQHGWANFIGYVLAALFFRVLTYAASRLEIRRSVNRAVVPAAAAAVAALQPVSEEKAPIPDEVAPPVLNAKSSA